MSGDPESRNPDNGRVNVRWDDSKLRSAYANVFNVAGNREEVVFLFGVNQAFNTAQKELTIELTDRIVLSPFVAKRLSIVLSNAIKEYESKYGKLDVESRRGAETVAGGNRE
jgi:hypothetical protein